MANQQWNGEFIDIADDDGDEDYEHNIKPVIAKAIGGYHHFQTDDDSSGYMDGPRSNQYYWTTEATKALIKLRGDREAEFELGGARKSLIWIEICKKMQSMGYDFSAEKVSKKWHNIMITYHKNISKKNLTGHVNWEFFDEIDRIYKQRRATSGDYDEITALKQLPEVSFTPFPVAKRKIPQLEPVNYYDDSNPSSSSGGSGNDVMHNNRNNRQPPIHHDPMIPEVEYKKIKFEPQTIIEPDLPAPDIDDDDNTIWWKEYLEKKLELEREKMKREQERHKDNMNFQKMTLMLQEKMEKIKVDAINNLTNAIIKLSDQKTKKVL